MVRIHGTRINSDLGTAESTPTAEMFHSASLTTLLVLGLLAKRVITAPASTHRSDAPVSLSPRIVTFSTLLNDSEISWGSCESFDVNGTDTNYECACFEVPMDYYDSFAGNARLAVIKLAATGNKLGAVFFNPGSPLYLSFMAFHRYPILTGGPGDSGVEALTGIPQ